MTNDEIAALRQQATAVRAQLLAALMGADALLSALPAPQAPMDVKPPLRYLGSDETAGESK